MPVESSEIVSATVLLRSANGADVSSATAITSANIAELAPAPEAVKAVSAFFSERGFQVGPMVGVSLSITASAERFQKLFGGALGRRADGAIVLTHDGKESLELPLNVLPDDIRGLISAISFSPPPDFGPSNF